ncbi:MAG: hypothetical protein HY679_00860 [Chloroflexi bacterium]|nr:hypothetical protein [Chloroflexota bacterium]
MATASTTIDRCTDQQKVCIPAFAGLLANDTNLTVGEVAVTCQALDTAGQAWYQHSDVVKGPLAPGQSLAFRLSGTSGVHGSPAHTANARCEVVKVTYLAAAS